MKHPFLRSALITVLASFALSIPAQSVKVGGVTVSLEESIESFLESIDHGTHLFTFTVANGTTSEKRVDITLDGFGASGSISVAPGVVSSLVLRVPHSNSYNRYGKVVVTVDGKAWGSQDFYTPAYYSTRGYHYSGMENIIGLSPSVPDIDSDMRKGRTPLPMESNEPFFTVALSNAFVNATKLSHHYYSVAELAKKIQSSPALWPTDWLAYIGFDSLVIDPGDFAKMPSAVRSALRDYVDAGGCLAFVGADDNLGEASATFPLPAPGQSAPCGFGRVMLLHDLLPAADRIPISHERDLFAQTIVSRYGVWGQGGNSLIDKLVDVPIPNASSRTPVAALIILLVLFFILGGPVAMIVLARKNRRIWLYWVLPAFSAAVTAVIVLAVLLSEGTTVSVRLQSATLLDQTARRAITLGAIGFYAPVGILGGIEFPSEMDVTPLARPSGATVVCGARQRYSSAWVPARVCSFFRTREVGERHERLLVEERDDGTVEVVNALGAPIRLLRLRSADGILHGTESLPPGERRVLSRIAGPAAGSSQKYNAAFAEYLFAANKLGSPKAQGSIGWHLGVEPDLDSLVLDKGTYVALLDGSPFLSSPLVRGTPDLSTLSVVIGKYR